MKRYVPLQPHSESDLLLAKSRLRVAAIQAGPAALVRRHPLSSVLGTTAGTFAVTAIVKLFTSRKSTNDSSHVRPAKVKSKSPSLVSMILRSALSMGLPIIQSQLTRHFVSKQHDEQSTVAADAQESPNAVG